MVSFPKLKMSRSIEFVESKKLFFHSNSIVWYWHFFFFPFLYDQQISIVCRLNWVENANDSSSFPHDSIQCERERESTDRRSANFGFNLCTVTMNYTYFAKISSGYRLYFKYFGSSYYYYKSHYDVMRARTCMFYVLSIFITQFLYFFVSAFFSFFFLAISHKRNVQEDYH